MTASDSPAVLVTGASRGIGRAIAIALARRGDRIAVHYASARADAEATLDLLPGTGHTLVGGDLADPDDIPRIMDAAQHALGRIHTLVNNAALGPTRTNTHRIEAVSYAEWQSSWRSMIDVNLSGAANLTYAFARQLIDAAGEDADGGDAEGANAARGHLGPDPSAPVDRAQAADRTGTIVNIGSRGVFVGEPDHPAYAATKGALHAFSQTMAVALAPHGISVATVAPGFVSTDRQASKLVGPAGADILAQSPFGRVGSPEEVAAAVRYLTSAEAVWASGSILDLNGASHLRS